MPLNIHLSRQSNRIATMKIRVFAFLGLAFFVTPSLFCQSLWVASFPSLSSSGVRGRSVLQSCYHAYPTGSMCTTNPYQTTITVRNGAGRYIATIRTDTQGRFQAKLFPGRYTLTPYVKTGTVPTGGTFMAFPYAPPVQVVVPYGLFTRVTIIHQSSLF